MKRFYLIKFCVLSFLVLNVLTSPVKRDARTGSMIKKSAAEIRNMLMRVNSKNTEDLEYLPQQQQENNGDNDEEPLNIDSDTMILDNMKNDDATTSIENSTQGKEDALDRTTEKLDQIILAEIQVSNLSTTEAASLIIETTTGVIPVSKVEDKTSQNDETTKTTFERSVSTESTAVDESTLSNVAQQEQTTEKIETLNSQPMTIETKIVTETPASEVIIEDPFCFLNPRVCGDYGTCFDISDDSSYTCSCNEGYYFDGQTCVSSITTTSSITLESLILTKTSASELSTTPVNQKVDETATQDEKEVSTSQGNSTVILASTTISSTTATTEIETSLGSPGTDQSIVSTITQIKQNDESTSTTGLTNSVIISTTPAPATLNESKNVVNKDDVSEMNTYTPTESETSSTNVMVTVAEKIVSTEANKNHNALKTDSSVTADQTGSIGPSINAVTQSRNDVIQSTTPTSTNESNDIVIKDDVSTNTSTPAISVPESEISSVNVTREEISGKSVSTEVNENRNVSNIDSSLTSKNQNNESTSSIKTSQTSPNGSDINTSIPTVSDNVAEPETSSVNLTMVTVTDEKQNVLKLDSNGASGSVTVSNGDIQTTTTTPSTANSNSINKNTTLNTTESTIEVKSGGNSIISQQKCDMLLTIGNSTQELELIKVKQAILKALQTGINLNYINGSTKIVIVFASRGGIINIRYPTSDVITSTTNDCFKLAIVRKTIPN